jgi:N-carbamoylputrescine amidase
MRATVCELPAEMARLEGAWERLVAHVSTEASDLVLLPEMPFHRWLASTKDVDAGDWEAAIAAHDTWQARYPDLGDVTVLGARPVVVDGRRLNEAFVWEGGEYRLAHHKYYLPDEDGFWEATWYDRGDGTFEVAETAHGAAGFMICSELWFLEHARAYGRAGAAIIANPRATEWASRDKWLAAGRVAAVSGGAFCLSSNRSGTDASGLRWGGYGWVVDPDGTVLATTSERAPYATVDIDLLDAEKARHTYPRYVEE